MESTIPNPLNYVKDLEKEDEENLEEPYEIKEEKVGEAIVDLNSRFSKYVKKTKDDICRIWCALFLVFMFMTIVFIILLTQY